MKQKIAFDVDGCLITTDNKPNYKIIELLKWFQGLGWEIYIHSGGGIDYAKMWADKLGLESCRIVPKGSPDYEYDIVVDDAIDPEVSTIEGKKNIIKTKVFIKVWKK